MEDNNKIRVGITHGDINGVGYEVILKTFADPTMLELCTPIIYGSPKVAAYHRKAMDIQANFSIINSADDAMTYWLQLLSIKIPFSRKHSIFPDTPNISRNVWAKDRRL